MGGAGGQGNRVEGSQSAEDEVCGHVGQPQLDQPLSCPSDGKEALIYPQTYSEADMDPLTGYLLEHYLRQPNCWRIGDQPVFAIFNIDGESGILRHFNVF